MWEPNTAEDAVCALSSCGLSLATAGETCDGYPGGDGEDPTTLHANLNHATAASAVSVILWKDKLDPGALGSQYSGSGTGRCR